METFTVGIHFQPTPSSQNTTSEAKFTIEHWALVFIPSEQANWPMLAKLETDSGVLSLQLVLSDQKFRPIRSESSLAI
jgi:hypothetical protein